MNLIPELLKNNERLLDFYNVGPVQRAAVEDFVQVILKESLNIKPELPLLMEHFGVKVIEDEGTLEFDNGWVCFATKLTVHRSNIWGYLNDGHHWFHYDREEKVFNVHIPPLDWTTPSVVHKNVGLVNIKTY